MKIFIGRELSINFHLPLTNRPLDTGLWAWSDDTITSHIIAHFEETKDSILCKAGWITIIIHAVCAGQWVGEKEYV